MAKATTDTLKSAAPEAKDAEQAPSLYHALDKASEKALASGNHAAYAALHPVVVALAGVKFAASQATHEHVSEEARELLDRIKSL
ncbi:hypothetical protein [Paraburkholderia tagetis]|uniref:Uncharacterized protein n=1 Tax=Paraburkholderia tagetis TaxID=2913261 RepID=A0A9X1RG41_9BURK|nr:hypothetical protein [Paraburkholderia tagetis]MCG5072271.1 hypothetical protein [Paraburkholderia tagetis]